jgi:hypothetical protein
MYTLFTVKKKLHANTFSAIPKYVLFFCLHVTADTVVSKTCPQDCLDAHDLLEPNLLKTPSSENSGGWLNPDQCLVSENGAHKLCFQSDGNLVLYNKTDDLVWESGTAGKEVDPMLGHFTLSASGQISAYRTYGDEEAYWETPNLSAEVDGRPFRSCPA